MAGILIISDIENVIESIKKQLMLIRAADVTFGCPFKNYKKYIKNFDIFIINEEDKDNTVKAIQHIKSKYPNKEILILTNDITNLPLIEYFDNGMSDYLSFETPKEEILIKIMNCQNVINLKNKIAKDEIYLEQTGIINIKNNVLQIKYLKEVYKQIRENKEVQNGVLCVLTLDENSKTKVSLNRLAGIIKKHIRQTDIIAEKPKEDLFYIMLENIDLINARSVIEKLQYKMGNECKIRAGISKIGIQNFDDLEKDTIDSLKCAIKNNDICASLGNYIYNSEQWIETDQTTNNKPYKIFQKAYENKLKNIVEPLFFKLKKDLNKEFKNATINYYVNKIESALCISENQNKSEILILFDGYTKLTIKINHMGLQSAENSTKEIALNKFSEKEFLKLLKQFRNEYKKGAIC